MKEFTLMLLAHTLGDYYFQPQALARLKSRSTWYVLIHAAIYAASMFATLLLFNGRAYLTAVVISAATHAAIDIVKQLILNGAAKRGTLTVRQERAFYLGDQAAHLTIILILSFAATNAAAGAAANAGSGVGTEFLTVTLPALTGMDGFRMLTLLTALLAVMKPANVFIKKVLVTEKPDAETNRRLSHGGGIGALERIVMLSMLYLGQYAAIALVFTAKSIARFKELDNRGFAEYYIYGTLLSVVTTMAVFGLLEFFGV